MTHCTPAICLKMVFFKPRTKEKNPPITVYDTSGPFTDPNIEIDIRKGLPRIREQWILDRNDVEELTEISSDYGKSRLNDEKRLGAMKSVAP